MIRAIVSIVFTIALGTSYATSKPNVQLYDKPLGNTLIIDSKNYNPFEKGQCTWFVYGAVKQELGITLKFSQNYGRHANKWHKLLDLPLHKEPRANSIAVYNWKKYGHVTFVVDTFKDSIVFRETNTYAAKNGKLQIQHKDTNSKHLVGYLYL